MKEKGSFDGIANKFDANIYGTRKGQIRHHLLVEILEPYMNKPPMNVLDIGGGTGMMSLEFAKRGHAVTIVDISQDVLDIAKERLSDFPSTSFIKLDVTDQQQMNNANLRVHGYDFLICHALLEWIKDPKELLTIAHSLLANNARMSLSFFNLHAKEFNNLLFANFDYIEKGMPNKNTVRLNPHHAQKPEDILTLLDTLEKYDILSTQGIRCIHDYILDKSRIEPQYEKLLALEAEYGKREPFKWLGKYFHIMLKAL